LISVLISGKVEDESYPAQRRMQPLRRFVFEKQLANGK